MNLHIKPATAVRVAPLDVPARHGPGHHHALSAGIIFLMAVAAGLAVANICYSQPLLDAIADDVGLSRPLAGLVGTLTQTGYAVGLVLVAPLGDLVDRRGLIMGQLLLSAGALGAVVLATDRVILLGAMAVIGLLAVAAQVIVAHAATLALPNERGRVVGVVTSGIIIGILLARTVAGALSDWLGWRAVYLAAAATTLCMVVLLGLFLPRQPVRNQRVTYVRLILSMLQLFAEERILRVRSLLALFIFFSITVLLTPLVLPLAAPPYALSHTVIGLFGLAGAAGALGAISAGRLADRGGAETVTFLALALMLAAWGAAALLPYSIGYLVLAVVVMDYGLQAAHVANQSLIYRVRPDAQSRLAAGYMIAYSVGCGAGSLLSTLAYAHAGWAGVCLLGAAGSSLALGFWAVTRPLAVSALAGETQAASHVTAGRYAIWRAPASRAPSAARDRRAPRQDP
jgi:predicted MFS family arabinose efflux permease